MTINRRVGLGFTLGCDAANGTSFTTLGAIVDGWKGPQGKKETVNISVLADTYMVFGVSQIDGGEVTFKIAYDPDEATSTTLNTLFAQVNQTPANWQIHYPVGSNGSGSTVSETFHAHVVGLSKEVKVNELMTCEVSLKITGSF